MKIKKKFVISIMGICLFLLVLAFIIPAPIEGYWDSKFVACMCDAHNFLLFQNGSEYYYSGNSSNKYKAGGYKKISWHQYSWYDGKHEMGVIKPGWISGKIKCDETSNYLMTRYFAIFRDREFIEKAARNYNSRLAGGEKPSDVSGK